MSSTLTRDDFFAQLGSLVKRNSPEALARMVPSLEASVRDRDELGVPTDKGYDQMWTHPLLMAGFFEALGLGSQRRFTAYDPAVGTGSAWLGVADRVFLSGVEIDPQVATVARTLFPDACIVDGDLCTFRPMEQFDLAGGAPPHALAVTDHLGIFATAGGDGEGQSQDFYLEQAMDALRDGGLLLALLPRQYHKAERAKGLMRALGKKGSLLAQIEVPVGTLQSGDWNDSVTLYVYTRGKMEDVRADYVFCSNLNDLPSRIRDVLHYPHSALRKGRDRFLALSFEATEPVPVEPVALSNSGNRARRRVLPVTDTVEVRIVPNGSRTVLVPNGQQAAARLSVIDFSSGRVFDAKRQIHTTRWQELLRDPFEYSGEEIVQTLRNAGITPVLTRDQVRRLERRHRWAERMMTPFEQTVWDPNQRQWVEAYAEEGVRTVFRAEYDTYVRRLEQTGISEVAFPYQVDDIARMALKNRILLGSDVGVGKSLEFIGYVEVRGIKQALVACNSRLVGKWKSEFEKWQARFPHLDLSHTVIEDLSDIGDVEEGRLLNYNKIRQYRFAIVSYESLWRIPSDSIHRGKSQKTTRRVPVKRNKDVVFVTQEYMHVSKYSLASHLRAVYRHGAVIADEAYHVKDQDANQTAALMLLEAKCRIAACATLIRNYIDDILAILNWVYGERSLLFRRYGLWTQGEIEAFVRRFGTFVHYEYDDETRKETRRMIPKVANPEEFRRLIAPMMLRRVRAEPEVAPFVGSAAPEVVNESIPMSQDHYAYYDALIGQFKNWWSEYREEMAKKGREIHQSQLLAKLRVLQTASTCPQSESLTINGKASVQYVGGLTAKQRRTVELVRLHAARGEKVVVFCQIKHGISILADAMSDLNPIVITGDVSLNRSKRTGFSKRDRELAAFREKPEHQVLVASQKCLCEGYDIPEASVAIFHESDWTPSVDAQALGRLRRPQQTRPITCYVLTHSGTVDEYVALISGAKGHAHAEVLDDAEYLLDLGMIPDIQDYANGIRDGLTLDRIQPTRRVSRITVGDLEVYNAMRDGLIKGVEDLEAVLGGFNRRKY